MPNTLPLNLDYSALTQPLTQNDILTYKQARNKPKNNSQYFFIIVVLVFVLALLSVSFFASLDENETPQFGVFAAVLFVPAFMIGVALIIDRARVKRLARLNKFAAINGLLFTSDKDDPAYSGMIFSEGHTRRISEALTFADGKEIGNYTYVTGGGKNRQTHSWGYMRAKLVRKLPHMVLDSKVNNMFGGRLTNLPATLTGGQTLRLEGDFNDHFTLYAPEMYKPDALYVFTPDVMAALIDFGNAYDIEVIDDYIIFYSSTFIRLDNETAFKDALTILDKISSELIDQADYYADERVGSRALNLVAEPGRRLKRRASTASIIIIVLYLLYFAWDFLSKIDSFKF